MLFARRIFIDLPLYQMRHMNFLRRLLTHADYLMRFYIFANSYEIKCHAQYTIRMMMSLHTMPPFQK